MNLTKTVGGGESWYYLFDENNNLIESAHEDNKEGMELLRELKTIGEMTHVEMGKLWRFAPTGHPYFSRNHPQLSEAFEERFLKFGGWTPELSREVGLTQ